MCTCDEFQGTRLLYECQEAGRTSVVSWKIPGVVSEEKVIVLDVCWSRLNLPRYWVAMLLFAVPGPPTSNTGYSTVDVVKPFPRHILI